MEHKGIALDCNSTKFGFEVPNKRQSLDGSTAACLIRLHPDLFCCFVSQTAMSLMCQRCVRIPRCAHLRMVFSLGRFADLDTLECLLVRP